MSEGFYLQCKVKEVDYFVVVDIVYLVEKLCVLGRVFYTFINKDISNSMAFKRFLVLIYLVFSAVLSAQSTASKQVTSFVIHSPELRSEKRIWVYLPKGYEDSKNGYPVIYMHDAQNLFDNETSYVGEWHVDEYLDSINSNHSIVVGIEHGNEKRIEELTPYKHENYGGGKGDDYISFIKNTLKPYIDHNYKTLQDASNTTLFGSSLGGLISIYGAIKYPRTFGKAGIFSPAFWVNPEIYEFVQNNKISNSLVFYFLAGTSESETMVPNQKRMVNLLLSKGVENNRISNNIVEGGEHNEKFWSNQFANAYQWLYNTKE